MLIVERADPLAPGPKALLENEVRYLVDPRVGEGTSWITGANIDQKHAHSVVAGRDFFADGVVEVKDRRSGDKRDVPLAELTQAVVTDVRG